MHLTPNSQVFLSELESGRCSSKVEVRLLRFWEYRYVRRGGELIISVDMLLIDWKVTTVNASRVPTFRPHLTAERYILSPDLMWLCCNPNFRDVFVTLSMFDSNTVSFHKRLEAMRGDPRKWLEVVSILMPLQEHTFISIRRLMLERATFTTRRCRHGRENMEGKTFTFQGGDNNNGPAGDDTVVAKVETGGSSEQSASNTGTAPTGDEQKTPPENASLKMDAVFPFLNNAIASVFVDEFVIFLNIYV
ncbi:hypothetical protein HID58_042376 [Brassica napus]|uniref:Uncharacterized protein n=2 Tax=Brassica napus TaxID=3708 RepID=A0ABQ8BEW5_BRANA|nr:hypothetical protein HID58_042376 [Brassica napus]